MRVCLVYDHLFPDTIGGGERWFRDLAVELAAAGHDVTYLTMRHRRQATAPSQLPGVKVIGLTDAGRVYADERRTLGPPVRFGIAVGRHLARHGRRYDVVHTAAFPYFPLLAASVLRRRGGYAVVVDWFEVWTRGYWRRYGGRLVGTVGWLVQRACARVPHRAHCLSRMHAARLVAEGYPGEPVVLPGIYEGGAAASDLSGVDSSLVVYAGRHVREKRIPELVRGFADARRRHPDLRLELYGDGPERAHVQSLVDRSGLDGNVLVAGPRKEEDVSTALGRAACLATASEREGYGLVVVEAAARGTPSVVVAGPENAATELVTEGVNGAIAASARAEDIAAAILRVVETGPALRASTERWFDEHADTLQLDRSLELIKEEYETLQADASAAGSAGRTHFELTPAEYERRRRGHLGRRRQALVREAIAATARPGTLVLEIGSGSGEMLDNLAGDRPDLDFVGLDVDERMIEYARSRHARGNVHFELADLGSVRPALAADFAFSVDVLHHVHDLPSFLDGVRAVLRDGATWLVIEPNVWHPYIFWSQSRMRRAGHDEDHFRPQRFERSLQRSGFDVIDRRYAFLFPGWIEEAPRAVAWLEPPLERVRVLGGSVVYRLERRPTAASRTPYGTAA